MKCYYEELGISRDASDGDIKTAYRKLALRWHPDKNPDCLEEAKERFQLIQQAYEVLSDPQERAWYDNHREQILRGKNSDYEENSLDLFPYFTSSCFKGYGDDSNGFYAVYRKVFEDIIAEEAEFFVDEEDISEIPTFGNSKSNYEEVVGPFYAYWQAFCTKKTYTWLCPYDILEVRERRIIRAIEKDMKKVVQKAKRERNEEVRNLVSFVRKRDKRVQAYKQMLEERAELNREKLKQNRLEQIRKRQKEVEEMRANTKNNAFSEGYEEELKKLEQEYGSSCSDEEYDEDDEDQEGEIVDGMDDDCACEETGDYVDDLYCVACNKAFKNANAFANHETSRKHRENVERLREQMQEEEASYQELAGESEKNEDDIENELKEAAENIKTKYHLNSESEITNDEMDEQDKEPIMDANTKSKKSKKAKKTKKVNPVVLESTDEKLVVCNDLIEKTNLSDKCDDEDDDWNNSGKKNAKRNKSKKQTKKSQDNVTSTTTTTGNTDSTATAITTTSTLIPESPCSPCETVHPHICCTCNATFESKNKLFAHLKKTNHSVYIPKAPPEPESKSGKKKNKGKQKNN